MWAGTVRSAKGLPSTDRQRKGELSLSLSPAELGHTSSLALGHQSSSFSGTSDSRVCTSAPCPRSSGLQTRTEPCYWLPWFTSLQMAQGGRGGLSTPNSSWFLWSTLTSCPLQPGFLPPSPPKVPLTLDLPLLFPLPETPSRNSLITTHFYRANPYPRNGLLQETMPDHSWVWY